MHWPSYPYSLGSYAAYKKGQWTTIRGAEFKPVGNLFFAGEHCSLKYQGYMNGAAETGFLAAQEILKVLK
jgi:monoamine oxidase